jgi:hypothetical protein
LPNSTHLGGPPSQICIRCRCNAEGVQVDRFGIESAVLSDHELYLILTLNPCRAPLKACTGVESLALSFGEFVHKKHAGGGKGQVRCSFLEKISSLCRPFGNKLETTIIAFLSLILYLLCTVITLTVTIINRQLNHTIEGTGDIPNRRHQREATCPLPLGRIYLRVWERIPRTKEFGWAQIQVRSMEPPQSSIEHRQTSAPPRTSSWIERDPARN